MKLLEKEFSFGKLIIENQKPEVKITEVKQIHSDFVVSEQETKEKVIEGDGLYYLFSEKKPLFPLAIKTADCQAVVIRGKKGIAFVHAGWRGVHQKILISPKILFLEPEYYYFSPSIKKCCYEVGKEFKDYFPNYSFPTSPPYFFDMGSESEEQIKYFFKGKKEIEFEKSSICTFCDSNYQSFRRDKNQKRNYNLLYIK